MRRAVVVSQDRLGDYLCVTPVFEAIKRAHPECEIESWVRGPAVDLAQADPLLSSVLAVPYRLSPASFATLYRRLKASKPDAILLTRNNSRQFTLLARAAGTPIRSGHTEYKYGRLLTHNAYQQGLIEHRVLRNLRIVEPVAGPPDPSLNLRAFSSPEDLENLRPTGRYFVVHPATGGSSKAWIPERYGETAGRLSGEHGLTPVFTGIEPERDVVETALAACEGPAIDLTGKTSPRGLVELCRHAEFVLCGNTSTLHIAAAVQTPCVVVDPTIAGEDRMKTWHPWNSPYEYLLAKVECKGCEVRCYRQFNECAESISVAEVVSAASRLCTAGTHRGD